MAVKFDRSRLTRSSGRQENVVLGGGGKGRESTRLFARWAVSWYLLPTASRVECLHCFWYTFRSGAGVKCELEATLLMEMTQCWLTLQNRGNSGLVRWWWSVRYCACRFRWCILNLQRWNLNLRTLTEGWNKQPIWTSQVANQSLPDSQFGYRGVANAFNTAFFTVNKNLASV